MKAVYLLLAASAMGAWLVSPAEAAKTYQYSERVQRACANGYHAKCGEYGVETQALRICMNKQGSSSRWLRKCAGRRWPSLPS